MPSLEHDKLDAPVVKVSSNASTRFSLAESLKLEAVLGRTTANEGLIHILCT